MENGRRPIMIVDDDARSREFISTLLSAAGYEEIVEVETGEEALVVASAEHPCLVLLDVVLPGISGYEVCHQLRARFGERLPIVFVSERRSEPHDRVAGLLIGADDYLVKPFFPGELVARIRRLLIRNGAESATDGGESGVIARLSEREREVLIILAAGRSQDAIAAELFISPKTVGSHIQRILAKLDVHSRAEAVALAYREGLVAADVTGHP
jgi:DNA-binding NarL/FixJ family response regulator